MNIKRITSSSIEIKLAVLLANSGNGVVGVLGDEGAFEPDKVLKGAPHVEGLLVAWKCRRTSNSKILG